MMWWATSSVNNALERIPQNLEGQELVLKTFSGIWKFARLSEI